jgi:hypothetical protein
VNNDELALVGGQLPDDPVDTDLLDEPHPASPSMATKRTAATAEPVRVLLPDISDVP